MDLALKILLFWHVTWLGFYLTSRWRGQIGVGTIAAALIFLAVGILNTIIEPSRAPMLVLALPVAVLGGWEIWTRRGSGESPSHPSIRAWALVIVAAWGLFIPLRDATWLADTPVMYALALPVFVLGVWSAREQARESGEGFLPDMARSYDYALLISAVFGGQVVLAMWLETGATKAMLWLLLGTLTASIITQVYLDRVQDLLDQIAFANIPWLREERSRLREQASILPRVNMTDPLTMDEDEFARLTRRALSDFGDLTKLATSPLTNLPMVYRRLAEQGVEPTTLERAGELKILLAEAIEQLKPRTGDPYGTTDEWRFYNALYYPYVIGMRPYSSRAVHAFDEASHWEILEWFRTYVPERTLHNWQNATARLVAQHLREQEHVATSDEPALELMRAD